MKEESKKHLQPANALRAIVALVDGCPSSEMLSAYGDLPDTEEGGVMLIAEQSLAAYPDGYEEYPSDGRMLIRARAEWPVVNRVIFTAGVAMFCYRRIQEEAEHLYPDSTNDQQWHKVHERQAHLDAIRALMMAGLLDDKGYDLQSYRVKIGDVWYDTQATPR